MDVAAQALIELLDCPAPVVHLAHPEPALWGSVFGRIADCLSLPLVEYGTWLESLKRSGDKLELSENPAVKLLPFFESRVQDIPPYGPRPL